eukprot:SAG25_NODE_264_length_10707_cov_19.216043_14_plen_65_part_00
MEIFSYHPDLKKWVEVGNSGMFRPEMMLPYPLPPDVRAIAWGLSLERCDWPCGCLSLSLLPFLP